MNSFCERWSMISSEVQLKDIRLLRVDVVPIGIKHKLDVNEVLKESLAHGLILRTELNSDFEARRGK